MKLASIAECVPFRLFDGKGKEQVCQILTNQKLLSRSLAECSCEGNRNMLCFGTQIAQKTQIVSVSAESAESAWEKNQENLKTTAIPLNVCCPGGPLPSADR